MEITVPHVGMKTWRGWGPLFAIAELSVVQGSSITPFLLSSTLIPHSGMTSFFFPGPKLSPNHTLHRVQP